MNMIAVRIHLLLATTQSEASPAFAHLGTLVTAELVQVRLKNIQENMYQYIHTVL